MALQQIAQLVGNDWPRLPEITARVLVILLIVDTKKLNQMIELLEYLTKSTALTPQIPQ